MSWFKKKGQEIWNWLEPTPDEAMAVNDAKTLVIKLVAKYSIEEQTSILIDARNELISHRREEIRDTEKHLERLNDDLKKNLEYAVSVLS